MSGVITHCLDIDKIVMSHVNVQTLKAYYGSCRKGRELVKNGIISIITRPRSEERLRYTLFLYRIGAHKLAQQSWPYIYDFLAKTSAAKGGANRRDKPSKVCSRGVVSADDHYLCGLIYWAARLDRLDILQKVKYIRLMEARRSSCDLMSREWPQISLQNKFEKSRVYNVAAMYDSASLLKWLEEEANIPNKASIIYIAMREGSIAVIRWWIKMASAKDHNHLARGIKTAIKYGAYRSVHYVISIYPSLMRRAIGAAAFYGRIDLLGQLFTGDRHCFMVFSLRKIMINASRNGHVNVLKWLWQNCGFNPTESLLWFPLESLRWSKMWKLMARHGHLPAIKWWHNQCLATLSAKIVSKGKISPLMVYRLMEREAIAHNRRNVLKWVQAAINDLAN